MYDNRINKKNNQRTNSQILKKIKIGKSLNAQKYCGALKWDQDGLEFQKKLRNEWD